MEGTPTKLGSFIGTFHSSAQGISKTFGLLGGVPLKLPLRSTPVLEEVLYRKCCLYQDFDHHKSLER